MERFTIAGNGEPQLRFTTTQYLAAYALLSHATSRLELLAQTRGAYRRTRRSIARVFATVMLVGALVGLWTPATSHATPVFAAPVADGLFTRAWSAPLRSSPALADIDGDGALDMFVGGFNSDTVGPGFKFSSTYFLENQYSPPFGWSFSFVGQDPYGLSSSSINSGYAEDRFHGGPALGDIDHDGDLDLFAQDVYGGTRFFENTGNADAAAFTLGADPTGWSGGFGDADVLVDIDGDGDLDVFHGTAYYGTPVNGPSIVFQENTGNADSASFGTPVADAFGLVAPDQQPSPAFFDVDGDGDLDVLTGMYGGGFVFQENTGTAAMPSFAAPVANPYGLTAVPGKTATPAIGDVDGDGDDDLFAGNDDGHLYFYKNTEINCGDDILDPSEACDLTKSRGQTCAAEGYDGPGSGLFCNEDCLGLNFSTGCKGIPCPETPREDCLAPGLSQLQIENGEDPSVKFQWKKGAAFDQAALGNLGTTTDLALCIYDRTAGAATLSARIGLPTLFVGVSGSWKNKDPRGFTYADKEGQFDAVTKVKFKTGAAGKTSASLQAQGDRLSSPIPDHHPLPTPVSNTKMFHQDPKITVQLIVETGLCLSSDFAPAGTKKNTLTQFKAK